MDKVKGLTPHRGILGYNSEIRRFRAYPAMLVVVVLIPLFYGGCSSGRSGTRRRTSTT